MESSFNVQGLQCFAPAARGGAWAYLPAAPDLQRDADCRPMVTLVDVGPSGYLMFTACLRASPRDVQALREHAARRSAVDSDQVTLQPAALEDLHCNVLVSDGHGDFEIAASNATSGMPPYNALFNIYLQEERLEHARASLRGDTGHLAIEYRARVLRAAAGEATLRTRIERIAPFLDGAGDDSAELARRLDRAVAEGAATVTIVAPDPDAAALTLELHRAVLERAAHLLPRLIREDATGDLQFTASLEQDMGIPVRAFADMATLVPAEALGSLIGGHHAAN